MNNFLERIIIKFPQNLSYAFAYGSGVFAQKNKLQTQHNVVDFIFVVDNPLEWHEENLHKNKKHYSLVKLLGQDTITNLQENSGAKVYFNTLVHMEGRIIKYGIIKTSNLLEDLLNWRTLYISGRLHKPVVVIRETMNTKLKDAIARNLRSAVRTSLLCLPQSFTTEQLFTKIVGLSYSGDFRMYIGEDKKKVENIVKSQLMHFHELYEGTLKSMGFLHWKQSQGILEQDCCPSSVYHHLDHLPRAVQHNLLLLWNKDGRYRDMEEVLQAIAHDSDYHSMISKAILDIVWWSSLTQSCKGILTAGLTKSIRYGSSKLFKMFKSMRS